MTTPAASCPYCAKIIPITPGTNPQSEILDHINDGFCSNAGPGASKINYPFNHK